MQHQRFLPARAAARQVIGYWQLGATPAFIRRGLALLTTASLLLVVALGAVHDADAQQGVNPGDPIARLQFFIKRVAVYEDMDWGAGEIELFGFVLRVKDGCSATSLDNACLAQILKIGSFQFSANDGEVITLNRTIPSAADTPNDPSVSVAGGISIIDGKSYRIVIIGQEDDLTIADNMGRLDLVINRENNWLIGTHVGRGNLDLSGRGGDAPAHFGVEYEIRRTSLPDLTPIAMIVAEGPGTAQDEICVTVKNVGTKPAGAFQLALHAGAAGPLIATTQVSGAAVGQTTYPCIHTNLPAGQYDLTAIVDEPRVVIEQNETNNRFAKQYTSPGGVVGGWPGALASPIDTGPRR